MDAIWGFAPRRSSSSSRFCCMLLLVMTTGGPFVLGASACAFPRSRTTRLALRQVRPSIFADEGVLSPYQRQDLLLRDPAVDSRRSADFLPRCSAGGIRQRGDGSTAFDTTGEVSGTWVLGRPASSQPGLLFYIMVDSVAACVDAVIAHGGALVQPIGADAPEVTARFRDPGGNVIGLYQEPGRSGESSA